MANRYLDWLRQADADLVHATHSLESGDFDWSCFSAQQAAEKAVKALFLRLGTDAWGHTVSALVGNLPAARAAGEGLMDCAKMLDKHYIPTRYPNGFDSGAPTDLYTRKEAQDAIACAKRLIDFCHDQVGRS